MKVGDRIEIQYHFKEAQFRVAWIIAHEGSSEKQIEAQCLEPESKFGERRSPSKWMSTEIKSDPQSPDPDRASQTGMEPKMATAPDAGS